MCSQPSKIQEDSGRVASNPEASGRPVGGGRRGRGSQDSSWANDFEWDGRKGEGKLGEVAPPGEMRGAIRKPQFVQVHLQVESGTLASACSGKLSTISSYCTV